MGGASETTGKNPIETLTRLLHEEIVSRIYIEQQDIYPIQSQNAARVLPVIEEEIERLSSGLEPEDLEIAHRWAESLGKVPAENGVPDISDENNLRAITQDSEKGSE